MRIDAHIHFTPPELKQRLNKLSESEPYWSLLLNPPDGKSIQGWADPERMIADMDAAGIDKVVIVGEYFRQHEACVARNNQAIELVNRYPERVLALATLQPAAGDQAIVELKRCIDAGLHGVGELNPYAQGVDLLDRRFLRLVDAIVETGVPLNLHVSEEIGGYYLGKSTTPLRDYYSLACRFPELKLILAHWGGGLFLYEIMPRVRKQLSRVWYDTAASPLLYPTKKIFSTALTCISHKKVLFGSDYPLLIYPSKMTEPDMRPFLNAIDRLEIEPEIYDDVIGMNAARLFQLDRFGPDDLPPAGSGLGVTQTIKTPVTGHMAVSMVAAEWPQTRKIFSQYNIPVDDQPVPDWEPIRQAATRQGHGVEKQRALLEKINQIILD
ncbi:MAG: putative TIM-barrel fold metal-dependent hydrolase [Candidatus Promineifilaceae bacterium]|jgi:predicted TIM-barrel fold metal-dependent hydrolase